MEVSNHEDKQRTTFVICLSRKVYRVFQFSCGKCGYHQGRVRVIACLTGSNRDRGGPMQMSKDGDLETVSGVDYAKC
jgi:hypothetical protein